MVIRYHLHRFNNCVGDRRWRLVYQQLEELLLVVLDDWGLVRATGKQSSRVQVDMLLFESLGLTKEGSIFYPYSQLHMSLLPFPDTFMMDTSMRRDRQWQRAWGVPKLRPPGMSIFTTSIQVEMDRHR
jgi:hypothetical protein